MARRKDNGTEVEPSETGGSAAAMNRRAAEIFRYARENPPTNLCKVHINVVRDTSGVLVCKDCGYCG